MYEEREVAIFDIPGAYLHASMPDEHKVILRIKGQFVDIMCMANPEFQKYVIIEKGIKVLYLKVLRALYGCIRSAMLWYNLYKETLEKEGYTLNPYDRCVANKYIDRKQCTLVRYVDDNKISHESSEVVTQEVKMISKYFGDLTITRGNEFDFLGMKIKLDRENKQVKILMTDQIEEALEMLDEELKKSVTRPAYTDLFETYDENSIPLEKERKDKFHSIVSKLLFITKRARPDIETAISYLTTRVSKSTIMKEIGIK